jgi:uncharacterized membrane protein YfcA
VNPLEDLELLIAAFVASLFGQGGGVLYTPVQIWGGVDLSHGRRDQPLLDPDHVLFLHPRFAQSARGRLGHSSGPGSAYHSGCVPGLVIPVMLLVGMLTSMVGIGGGVLEVPLMVLLFGVPMSIAVGSSAFMVRLTATAGLLGHASVGHFGKLPCC